MAAPLGLTFAAEGANVAFHFNSSGDGAVEAAELARGLGVKAVAIGADLRDRAAVEAAVAPGIYTTYSERAFDAVSRFPSKLFIGPVSE